MKVRYRYRLRVSIMQATLLQQIFDADRFVWNTALGRWGDLWQHEGGPYFYGDAAAELTDWRGRFDWLAAQPAVPQQQTLRDLFKAISAFFVKKNPTGRPKFKGRKTQYATPTWV